MILSSSTHPYPLTNTPFSLERPDRDAPKHSSADITSDGFELKNVPQAASPQSMMGRVERLLKAGNRSSDISLSSLTTYGTVTHGNEVTQGLDRAYFTDMVLPAIRNAKDSVHIAMLAMDGGRFPNYVADLLIAKKRENPDFQVRIIADDVGSAMPFGFGDASSMVSRLRAEGIGVEVNTMARDGLEHRKLIVVDGETAFFGGACFSDPYFGSNALFAALDKLPEPTKTQAYEALWLGDDVSDFVPHITNQEMHTPEWQDYGVQVRGPAVHQLQANFLETWAFQGGRIADSELPTLRQRYFPPAVAAGNVSGSLSFAVPGGPSELRRSLLSTIESASETLDIEMAYIFEEDFIEALVRAAERGVDVRLVTNSLKGIDFFVSWHLNRPGYERLLKAGVQLFETDRYTHRKQVVVDDRFVYVSTGNPEYNSWERGFDINAILDAPDLAKTVKAAIETGMNEPRAELVTVESLKSESLWVRFQTWIFGILERIFLRSKNHQHESLGLIGPRRSNAA